LCVRFILTQISATEATVQGLLSAQDRADSGGGPGGTGDAPEPLVHRVVLVALGILGAIVASTVALLGVLLTHGLLQHWRSYPFQGLRPFFCQIEAVETAIWLTEVAPQQGERGKKFLAYLQSVNEHPNPELFRIALKLATGVGRTTVIAMLIAWQTINAVRRPGSKMFTRGFLICTPGITISDLLRVVLPIHLIVLRPVRSFLLPWHSKEPNQAKLERT
jgi:hypothetical protein